MIKTKYEENIWKMSKNSKNTSRSRNFARRTFKYSAKYSLYQEMMLKTRFEEDI